MVVQSLLNSSDQTSGVFQRWFLESGQVGVPEAGRIEDQGGPSGSQAAAQSREKEWGRRPRPTSAPAPGQPLPRRDSPAIPTPSPAAPSGRRGPALLSRAPGSDLLRALGGWVGDRPRPWCLPAAREGGKGGKSAQRRRLGPHSWSRRLAQDLTPAERPRGAGRGAAAVRRPRD